MKITRQAGFYVMVIWRKPDFFPTFPISPTHFIKKLLSPQGLCLPVWEVGRYFVVDAI
jgi:hypothetical protein